MRDTLPILLVEDNEADVELALRAFKRRRLANPIVVARDGEEALNYVHQRGPFTHGAAVPAVILLDLRLPKLSGLEVLREIKSHPVYKHVPLVVLTTSNEDRDIQSCYEVGAASYIVKPVEYDKFQEVVDRIDLYWIVTNVPSPLVEGR